MQQAEAPAPDERRLLNALGSAYLRYDRRERLYQRALEMGVAKVAVKVTVPAAAHYGREIQTDALWAHEALYFAKQARDLAGRLEARLFGA